MNCVKINVAEAEMTSYKIFRLEFTPSVISKYRTIVPSLKISVLQYPNILNDTLFTFNLFILYCFIVINISVYTYVGT